MAHDNSSWLELGSMSDSHHDDSLMGEKENEEKHESNSLQKGSMIPSIHQASANSVFVNFETPFDPADPLQWPRGKKLGIVINIALLSAVGQMASSMVAPSAEQIIIEFRTTSLLLATLVVSVFMIGMAIGLLLISGISEVYGRCVVIHVTNLLFVVFGVAAAVSQSLGQLIGFRFLQAVAAAAPPAIGGGVIGDMFEPRERGRATAIYGFGMLMGPMVGPIAGGYITQTLGWRWVCWVISIAGAVMLIATFGVLRESYRPLVLKRKVNRLRKETGKSNLVASIPHQSSGFEALRDSIVRPVKLLILSPTVALPALGLAVVFGMLFLMLSTLSTVYQQVYGWSTGASGLPYLGLGGGLFTGLVVYSVTADRAYVKLAKTATLSPEIRLSPITIGSPFCATGLIIYGWAFEKQLHWILPIIGCVIFSWGMVAFMMPVTTYLIDVFHSKAAGPVGAAAVLRCLVGGLLPLCAANLYTTLGYGWGNTLLAFIALIFAPFPYLFYRNGERLRERFPIRD
ncbi:hypothetical protein VM1G_10891 [Cytospora mali]|uniref:Major facilitator superfamily (MFS) profile domain-containing protein n=1 Tax=Cytospora mali TaxID=578113 RepID=A0A194VJC8_CYTMA|nr:hypothetical protein VM1G_10891 [Valsa mali]